MIPHVGGGGEKCVFPAKNMRDDRPPSTSYNLRLPPPQMAVDGPFHMWLTPAIPFCILTSGLGTHGSKRGLYDTKGGRSPSKNGQCVALVSPVRQTKATKWMNNGNLKPIRVQSLRLGERHQEEIGGRAICSIASPTDSVDPS